MRQIILQHKMDLHWLREVHLKDCEPLPFFVLAVLHGSEDCPQQIDLYATNDIRTKPTVYLYDSATDSYRKKD